MIWSIVCFTFAGLLALFALYIWLDMQKSRRGRDEIYNLGYEAGCRYGVEVGYQKAKKDFLGGC